MTLAELPDLRRLLVIDDNPAIHEDFRKILLGRAEVDADFAQFAQHGGAPAHRPIAQVAVCPLQRIVQNAVVGFQLSQLEVRQFEHIKRFVKILRLIDEQRGVPINDH